jgi:DNA-binding response OmpR family regulator
VELVAIGGADTAPPHLRLLVKAIAFDVDADSLASLREAFPEWEIEAVGGATLNSLERDWNPGAAHLLVVGARDQAGKALRLCRALRSQAGRALTPLLVLLRPEQEGLVSAALEAGADSCLVLPLQGKDLAGVVARALAGNRPGRHTLHSDRPQREDPWQDEGNGG